MKKRAMAITLIVVMIMAVMAGCGSSSYDSAKGESSTASWVTDSKNDVYYDYDYPEDDFDYSDEPNGDGSVLEIETEPGRLVILNANVSMETTDYGKTVEEMREKTAKFGGYVSTSDSGVYNSTYSLHSGTFTLRIPAKNFNDFIAEQEDIGSVIRCNVWSDDVTGSYREIETRLGTLRTKYDRLLAMLEKAELMSDIIEIENALSETTYEIERYEGCLKSYDDRISYSTITVDIREVRQVTEPVVLPKTLGERISLRFNSAMSNTADFFEDLIVGIVGALPGIVILGVIAAVVIIIIVKTKPGRIVRREKRRIKNEELVRELRAKRDASIMEAEKSNNADKNANTQK